MTVFAVLGVIGLLFLLLSLVVGDWIDGLVDLDLDVDSDGLLSGPVIGAFVAAFGIGGAFVLATTDAPLVVASLGGTANGLVVGYVAFRLTGAFMHMPTDPPVRTTDLVGKSGRVVIPIPDEGLGEMLVRHAGQPLKLSCRADRALTAGTPVVITEVLSSSSVVVTDEDNLFQTQRSHPA
jgi:hypothetical protein